MAKQTKHYTPEQKVIRDQQFKQSFEFWGLKYPTIIDSTVHVHTDTSIIGKKSLQKLDLDKVDPQKDNRLSRVATMGAQKSREKELRLQQLTKLIDDGQVKTTLEAITALPSIKAERTIIQYLMIIGRKLENSKGQVVGADEPNYTLLDKKLTSKGDLMPSKTRYKYYDGDPLKGGKQISEVAYNEKRRHDIRQLQEGN